MGCVEFTRTVAFPPSFAPAGAWLQFERRKPASSHWLPPPMRKGCFDKLLTPRKVHMSPGVCLINLQHVAADCCGDTFHRQAAWAVVSVHSGDLKSPAFAYRANGVCVCVCVCSLCHTPSLLKSLVHPDTLCFISGKCTHLLSRPFAVMQVCCVAGSTI